MIIFPGSIFWRMPLCQTLGQSLNRGTTSVDDAVPGIQTCRWSHRDRSFFCLFRRIGPSPSLLLRARGNNDALSWLQHYLR